MNNHTGQKLFEKVLFTPDEVDAQIATLAIEITKRFADRQPLFVCLLRGGVPFSSKLMFAIAKRDPHFQPELDYMMIRTYGDGRTAGKPTIVTDLSPTTKLAGRPAVILDDMLDTGVTANFVAAHLERKGASSVDLCVLVQKLKKQMAFKGQVIHGFKTPPDWQTGMGLDDSRLGREANRWAPYIAIANPAESDQFHEQ